jgi:Asp-tRNA(Asn)/Glu-tRNA(Gln) amidotransferase A subunit family amidase
MRLTDLPSAYTSHAADFASGRNSPLRLAEAAIEIVARREADLRAFVQIDTKAALDAARLATARWRAGNPLSPLDGMLLGVKDIIETREFPTGQGAPRLEPVHLRRDGATVQALREAGAIVLGKTVTTEFAATELFHDTRNPHDPARSPGGSSSGSAAAVGAGMVALALGSQVVGSTLRPASYCGVVGFKPSLGALNRGGSFDYLSQSCVGLIGGAIEDIWVAARQIATRVGGDPGHPGLEGPDTPPAPHRPARLMVLRTAAWPEASPAARAAFDAACASLAQSGIELVGPDGDARLAGFERAIEPAMQITWDIMSREIVWPLGTLVAQDPRLVSPAMQARLATGLAMTQADYAAALARRAEIRAQFAALIADFDGALTLSATGAAPAIGGTTGNPGFNLPASLLGVPAMSLPLLHDSAMPLGLQLIGAMGTDARTVAIGRWIADRLAGGASAASGRP